MEENKVNPAAEEATVPPEAEQKESPAAGAEEKAAPQEATASQETDKKGKKKKNREAEELEKHEKEKQELREQYLRLMAEYENYRKRTQKERESIYPDAVANTVKELLPVVDNFHRAMETPCTDENYSKGIQMIAASLDEFLKKLGVEAFGKVGDPFDPNLHNAVMHVDDESLEKNVVAAVFQSGYRCNDRILRHAMVQQAN